MSSKTSCKSSARAGTSRPPPFEGELGDLLGADARNIDLRVAAYWCLGRIRLCTYPHVVFVRASKLYVLRAIPLSISVLNVLPDEGLDGVQADLAAVCARAESYRSGVVVRYVDSFARANAKTDELVLFVGNRSDESYVGNHVGIFATGDPTTPFKTVNAPYREVGECVAVGNVVLPVTLAKNPSLPGLPLALYARIAELDVRVADLLFAQWVSTKVEETCGHLKPIDASKIATAGLVTFVARFGYVQETNSDAACIRRWMTGGAPSSEHLLHLLARDEHAHGVELAYLGKIGFLGDGIVSWTVRLFEHIARKNGIDLPDGCVHLGEIAIAILRMLEMGDLQSTIDYMRSLKSRRIKLESCLKDKRSESSRGRIPLGLLDTEVYCRLVVEQELAPIPPKDSNSASPAKQTVEPPHGRQLEKQPKNGRKSRSSSRSRKGGETNEPQQLSQVTTVTEEALLSALATLRASKQKARR